VNPEIFAAVNTNLVSSRGAGEAIGRSIKHREKSVIPDETMPGKLNYNLVLVQHQKLHIRVCPGQ